MTIRLFTLSPVHIGTGETLSPLDYIIDGETFYRVNQEELYKFVHDTIPSGYKVFSDWIGDQFAELREERNNKKQSELINQTNALEFFHSQGKRKELLSYLQRRPAGGQPIVLDDENRGRNQRKGDQERFGDIREGIRTGATGYPYIPGTSIKGAIRTALLYDVLMREGHKMGIERMVDRQLRNHVRDNRMAEPLEAEVFYCNMNEFGRDREREAQMDLLKWLSISDAQPPSGTVQPMGVAKINIYLVEKEQIRDSRNTPRLFASRQRQASYAEIISTGQELHTDWTFDGTTLHWLLQQEQSGAAIVRARGSNQDTYYKSLGKKVARLFKIDLQELYRLDAEALSKAALQHCQDAIGRFSKRQLAREDEWFEDYSAQIDRNKYADRIEAGYHPVDNYEGLMLHLGYASGFTATTAFLYFLQDKTLRDLFEKVMGAFELGKAPRQKGKFTPKISRFPKSRRFVESAGRIQPLGWMAVLKEADTIPEITFPTVTGIPKPKQKPTSKSTSSSKPDTPAGPAFPDKPINRKKQQELDAVVSRSGRPNKVKVYIAEGETPEVDLSNYRSPLEKGKVLRVNVQFSKRGKVVQVSFLKEK